MIFCLFDQCKLSYKDNILSWLKCQHQEMTRIPILKKLRITTNITIFGKIEKKKN